MCGCRADNCEDDKGEEKAAAPGPLSLPKLSFCSHLPLC